MSLRTFILAVLLVHLAKTEIIGQAVQVQQAQGYNIGQHIAEEPQFTYASQTPDVHQDS